MANECPMLVNCGFFRKYQESKTVACRGFIAMYCRGERQGQCKRRQYRLEHGTPPPDDMMPDGQMVVTTAAR